VAVDRPAILRNAEKLLRSGKLEPDRAADFEPAIAAPPLLVPESVTEQVAAVPAGRSRMGEEVDLGVAPELLFDLADALERGRETARALAICMALQAEAGHHRDVAAPVDRLATVRARG
jgi:hypothetical protein